MVEKKEDDDLNWFGEKLGAEKPVGGAVGGGVGKYLQAGGAAGVPKRPAPTATLPDASEDSKKRRKVGFGNFDGW